MNILVIISGEYGHRHVENIRQAGAAHHGPGDWEIEIWTAPPAFPPVIDDPEDFLPAGWYAEGAPRADLILAFAEHKGVAELLPDIAQLTGSQAVIAPVDREAWLPRGLARQLRGWLEESGVACVTPKPLCSLTETGYSVRRGQRVEFDAGAPGYVFIAEFARYFGQPKLEIDVQEGVIHSVHVIRDAVCGCTRFVAQGLIGVTVEEAEQKAGLLHHHYPCLAGMDLDTDYNDTLMHVSGNILKDQVHAALKSYVQPRYFVPGERSESES